MSVAVIEPLPRRSAVSLEIPPLENGDHLGASEFMRRYEEMPEVKKAELIQRRVHMPSAVRVEQHGEPDALINGWLGNYAIATPSAEHAMNSTTILGPDDVPQPDGLLRLLTECGGNSRVDAKGYLRGAPELVVEVAASSASLDAREKLDSYRRAGVLEYVLWRTLDGVLDWFVLQDDEYRVLEPGQDGVLRSQAFPGLWLDAEALINGDGAKVMQVLQQGLQSTEHATFVETTKP